MNRSCASLRICYLCTLALTLLAVVLRSIAMLCCFDAEIGYFQAGVLPTMCDVLCGLAVLAPLACVIAMPRQDTDALKARMQPTVAQSHASGVIPAAVVLTASALALLLYFRPVEPQATPKLLIWVFATGLITALFYAARCGLKLGTVVTVLLGFGAIAWSIVSVGYTYFDPYTTMNSPVKLSLQFGLIAAMLLVTSELRALMDRYAPRSGLFFHALAVFFCANASIPVLVAHFADVRQTTFHFLLACALLAVAIYATIRINRLAFSCDADMTSEESGEATEGEGLGETEEIEEAAASADEVVSGGEQ